MWAKLAQLRKAITDLWRITSESQLQHAAIVT